MEELKRKWNYLLDSLVPTGSNEKKIRKVGSSFMLVSAVFILPLLLFNPPIWVKVVLQLLYVLCLIIGACVMKKLESR
ncbi:hypothetical protein BS639_24005 [Rouxiella silvae]|uniref:Uncharacterized protein n=1 Tax=Rouxiella silvae TaxID=1646373 RepID=A0ABX3TTY7_9GAMM|nr:hypothetical protein [Rouxiella silvae]ORJ18671.1 hypothetical protein BS639_24005 [Rouxiella silvae]